jgi:hypothetical protein
MSIDSAYAVGDDVLANMVKIEFSPFSLFGPLKDALKFRTTKRNDLAKP